MVRHLRIIAATVVLLWASTVCAAFFQTAGQGVRPSSMGGAFVALSDDANSVWYNPAGLGRMQDTEIALTYAMPFTGLSEGTLNHSLVNFVSPWKFGLGFSRLGTEDAGEMAGALGFGLSLGSSFSIGTTAKLLHWSADGSVDPISGVRDDDRSATKFSFDLGLLIAVGEIGPADFVSLGVVVRDVIPPNISESGDDGGVLPRTIEAGLGIRRDALLIALDFGWRDRVKTLRGGGEFQVQGTDLFLRGGGMVGFGDAPGRDAGDLDVGLGYRFQRWSLDYAYTYPVIFQGSAGSHRASLTYRP